MIFNNKAQNFECSFGYVARSAVLLKLNVANILLFNLCEQKFVQHGPITIAIDCNGLSMLVFEEKLQNYDSGPKSAPNSDSFRVCRFINFCINVFCTPNATNACLKIWFFLQKSASSVKRSHAHIAKRCSSVYTAIFVQVFCAPNATILLGKMEEMVFFSQNRHLL